MVRFQTMTGAPKLWACVALVACVDGTYTNPQCSWGEPTSEALDLRPEEVIAAAGTAYGTMSNPNDDFPEPMPVHAERFGSVT